MQRLIVGMLIGIAAAALSISTAQAIPPRCTAEMKRILGECPSGQIENGQVSTSGSQTRSGTEPHGNEDNTPGSNATVRYFPPTPQERLQCAEDFGGRLLCWPGKNRNRSAPPEQPDTTSPGHPTITITDLASFSPAEGTILGEPDNLGVAGLPTNFITDAAAHTRSGELFGFPIDVRFTPAAYTFHYGDGQTKTTSTPGASWDTLAQAQFTPTDTSHTYAERGTYDANVDITYTAEINLGTGWFPIDGHLDIPGPTQQLRIYEAHTALVAHTCTEQPTAPGC